MLKHMFIRLSRNPVPAVGLMLFAAILTAVLCGLYSSRESTLRHYNEIYHGIDVTCVVTNPAGDRSDDLALPNWVIFLFTGEMDGFSTELADMLTDVQIKGSHSMDGALADCTLVGVTSTQMAQELWPENGCVITWFDGYDERLFQGGAPACLVPEQMLDDLPEGILPLSLSPFYGMGKAYKGALPIAGTYSGGSGTNIYCSWHTLTEIWDAMELTEQADALRARLKNNDDLEAFRTAAKEWFPQPDPNADPMSEGEFALDIRDSQLRQAEQTLQNSLKVNQIASFLVFVFSAAASFFVGFLMVRGRRREIALMRTMGTPRRKIWFSFALEQMLCVLLGAALGGAVFLWHPIGRLGLFLAVYFAGLALALLIFLHSRLITAVKEEE